MGSIRWDLAVAVLIGAAIGAAAVVLWDEPAAEGKWVLTIPGDGMGILRMNTQTGDIEYCLPFAGNPLRREGAICWPVPAPPADGENPFTQLPMSRPD